MRYSLENYYITITSINTNVKQLFDNIQIGGEGDALSSISMSYADTLWSTESFATGAWVHNKNLSRVGNVSVTISQLTDAVARFKTFCNYFYNESVGSILDGVTITLYNNAGEALGTAEDCYPTQIPEQSFGNTATTQTWQFTSGRITFH